MSSIPIPSDLIHQIQSRLRSNSPISPCSNPSLPSLRDSISAVDSDDPSIFRCSNCLRGSGLVRGAQSTLCILCGHDRGKDGITHSLVFNSTLACKNLLQSLHLDGSEVVNLETESNDSNKGQDIQQTELVLSSLLDLELKWPPEKEEAVNENLEKPHVSVPAVNLSGDDLDIFFTDSINRTAEASAPIVISENPMPLKQNVNTENHESWGEEEFNLFKDIRTSNVAESSSNIKGDHDNSGSFADWDASFQSAGLGNFQSELESDDRNTSCSKSVDLFECSTASHAIPEFEIKEHINTQNELNNIGNVEDSTDEWGMFPSSTNMGQSNLWPNSTDDIKSTSLTDENDILGKDEIWASNSKIKHDDNDDMGNLREPTDDWGNFSLSNNIADTADNLKSRSTTNENDSWGQDEIWATASNSKSMHVENDNMGNLGEPTDDWGNFSTSSNMIQSDLRIDTIDHLKSTSTTNENDSSGQQDDIWGTTSNTKSKHDDNDDMGNSGESIEDWGNFSSSDNTVQNDLWTNMADDLKGLSLTNENDSKGQDEIWASKLNNKSKHDDDDDMGNSGEPTDDWGNFSSSNNMGENDPWTNTADDLKSKSVPNENDSKDQDEIWASASNTKSKLDDNNDGGNHVEPTDDWGDFSFSANMIQNDQWANTADHLNNTSKTIENGSWDQDEIWATISNTKSKHVDTEDMGYREGSTEDWGNFSFSNNMIQNNLWTNTADHVKSASATNKIDSWGLDEMWGSSNTTNKYDNNDNNNFGDAFHSWQDFASANKAGEDNTSGKHASPLKSVDQQDDEFGEFLHSEPKQGALSSNEVNDIQLKNTDDHHNTKDNYNVTMESWSSGDLSNLWSQTIIVPTLTENVTRTKSMDPQDIKFNSFMNSNSISRSSSNPISLRTINGIDNIKLSYDNDDSFNAWQDFTSSKETSGTNTVNLHDSDFGSFMRTSSFSQVDGFKGSSAMNDMLLDALVSKSSTEFNISNNINVNNGLFEPWEDFISLSDAPALTNIKVISDEHKSKMKPTNLEDMEFGGFLQSDVFSEMSHQENSIKDLNDAEKNDHDDPFEDWQDFMSSNDAQASSADLFSESNNIVASYEHVSETKSMDLQEMGFSSFLPPESVSKGNDKQVASVSFRTNGETGADFILPGAADTSRK